MATFNDITNDHLISRSEPAFQQAKSTQSHVFIRLAGVLGFVALTLWVAAATSSAGHLVEFVR